MKASRELLCSDSGEALREVLDSDGFTFRESMWYPTSRGNPFYRRKVYRSSPTVNQIYSDVFLDIIPNQFSHGEVTSSVFQRIRTGYMKFCEVGCKLTRPLTWRVPYCLVKRRCLEYLWVFCPIAHRPKGRSMWRGTLKIVLILNFWGCRKMASWNTYATVSRELLPIFRYLVTSLNSI